VLHFACFRAIMSATGAEKITAVESTVAIAKGDVAAAEIKVIAAESKVVAAKEEVVAAKEEVVAAKEEVVAAKEEVVAAKASSDAAAVSTAETLLRLAVSGLESAHQRVQSAQRGVESAQRGVESAQRGVESAQEMLSALRHSAAQALLTAPSPDLIVEEQRAQNDKHIFTHGLPPLGPLSDGTRAKSKPSSPTDAKHAKATLILANFVNLSDVKSLPCPVTNIWNRLVGNTGHLGGYSNEAGVNEFVKLVMEDVLEAMGVREQVKLRAEVEVMSVRPDFTLLYVNGHPIGTIEGKQPGKDAMTDGNILGEVYDQLMHLHSIFGVDNPFAILTSYEEWRICWLNFERSNEVAALKELLNSPAIYTTPVKAQRDHQLADSLQKVHLKEESPEPPATPSRTRDIGCLPSVDGESEEEEKCFAVDDHKREFCGTEVISWQHKSLPCVLVSVVKKMMLARVEGEPSVVRVVDASTSVWKAAPKTLRYDLCISKRVKWFCLLEDLGHGADGRAFLVSGGTKGAIGVLKFFFEDAEQSAHHEAEMWKAAYSHLPAVSSVRVVKAMGHTALLMPWFQTPTRNEDTLAAIQSTLQDDFMHRGYRHDDVAWRNVGVYTDAGQLKAIVFDMKRVSLDANQEDWVTAAVSSLRRKLE
jgi:hypothetical protein